MAYSVTIGPHTSTSRCVSVCEPSVETEVRTERCLGCQIRHLKFHALPFSLTRLAHSCPPGTRSPFLHYLSSPSLALSFFSCQSGIIPTSSFQFWSRSLSLSTFTVFQSKKNSNFQGEMAPAGSVVYVHMLSALF